jgi:hypothetical protein
MKTQQSARYPKMVSIASSGFDTLETKSGTDNVSTHDLYALVLTSRGKNVDHKI